MTSRCAKGFSLLEVLMALMILSTGLTGILTYFGASQAQARRADALTTATMLARLKMAETVLDIEKRMEEGKFPDDEEKEGKFEGRYERYGWAVKIRKVQMPTPQGGDGQPNPMQMFLKQLKLDEAIREVKLTINWTVRNRERSMSVTTHMVKL